MGKRYCPCEHGSTFHEACAQFADCFPTLFLNMAINSVAVSENVGPPSPWNQLRYHMISRQFLIRVFVISRYRILSALRICVLQTPWSRLAGELLHKLSQVYHQKDLSRLFSSTAWLPLLQSLSLRERVQRALERRVKRYISSWTKARIRHTHLCFSYDFSKLQRLTYYSNPQKWRFPSSPHWHCSLVFLPVPSPSIMPAHSLSGMLFIKKITRSNH